MKTKFIKRVLNANSQEQRVFSEKLEVAKTKGFSESDEYTMAGVGDSVLVTDKEDGEMTTVDMQDETYSMDKYSAHGESDVMETPEESISESERELEATEMEIEDKPFTDTMKESVRSQIKEFCDDEVRSYMGSDEFKDTVKKSVKGYSEMNPEESEELSEAVSEEDVESVATEVSDEAVEEHVEEMHEDTRAESDTTDVIAQDSEKEETVAYTAEESSKEVDEEVSTTEKPKVEESPQLKITPDTEDEEDKVFSETVGSLSDTERRYRSACLANSQH